MQKFNWKNKGMWLGVLLVALTGLYFYLPSKEKVTDVGTPEVVNINQEGITLPKEEEEDQTPVPAKKSPATKTPAQTTTTAPKLTYGEALAKYKDTRIQFDNDCRATPSNATYKSGTEIMIDNRANVSRRLSVGTSFTVSSYGFKIIKLSSSVLPKTILVDCGDKQNVATILLQK